MKEKKYTPPIRRYSSQKWQGMDDKVRRDVASLFYEENIQPQSVINQHKNITINFNKRGRKKTMRVITPEKAVVIENFIQLLTEARLNNIGTAREKTHGEDALFFLNFKIVCYIDGVKRSYRVPVIVRTTGKFQYSLHDNGIWKME